MQSRYCKFAGCKPYKPAINKHYRWVGRKYPKEPVSEFFKLQMQVVMAVSCPYWGRNFKCQSHLQQTSQRLSAIWHLHVVLQAGRWQAHQQRQPSSFSKFSRWILDVKVSHTQWPTSVSSATPTCSGSSYAISASESCQSISMAKGISSYDLLQSNSLQAFCREFPTSGSLCIPSLLICEPYLVKENDTCSAIQSQYSIIYSQILAWNPVLGTSCTNIGQYVGYVICVSNPGGTWVNPSPTTSSIVPTITTLVYVSWF